MMVINVPLIKNRGYFQNMKQKAITKKILGSTKQHVLKTGVERLRAQLLLEKTD